MNSTYSFADLAVVLSHPSLGQLVLQGEGLGSITFAMAGDIAAHDVAADGSVMTSKKKAPNGTITVSVQQTSSANKWLINAYNYLDNGPSSEFAQMSLIGESKVMGVTHTASNMTIQKMPDNAYGADGAQVSWTLLAGSLKVA